MRRKVQTDERGFTLIELMVVVLIIAILIAIAIPTYLRNQQAAQDVQAKATLHNLVQMIETCRNDTTTYANCDTDAKLGGTGLQWGTGSGQVQITVSGTNTFVAIVNSDSGAQFWWQKSNGSYQKLCFTWPKPTAGCSGNGATW